MKRGGDEMMMETEGRLKVRRLIDKHRRGKRLNDDELISLVGNFAGLLLDADIITVETLAEWTEKIKSGQFTEKAQSRRLVARVRQVSQSKNG